VITFKNRRIELLFQTLDLLADRPLGQVQRTGGGRHAAMIVDRDKRTQEADIEVTGHIGITLSNGSD
jgi:hypothetical protein